MRRNHEKMGEQANRQAELKTVLGLPTTLRALCLLNFTIQAAIIWDYFSLRPGGERWRPTKRCCFFFHSVRRFLIPIRFPRPTDDDDGVAVVSCHYCRVRSTPMPKYPTDIRSHHSALLFIVLYYPHYFMYSPLWMCTRTDYYDYCQPKTQLCVFLWPSPKSSLVVFSPACPFEMSILIWFCRAGLIVWL